MAAQILSFRELRVYQAAVELQQAEMPGKMMSMPEKFVPSQRAAGGNRGV
jgi:hypothetical protein